MTQPAADVKAGMSRLAESGCPVAALEPRVEPRVYERDGYLVTLWTYHALAAPPEVSPAAYATALERLHASMRKLDLPAPHFTDRVHSAQQLVANRDHTPALAEADRELLGETLRDLRRRFGERRGAEQLLHGEPHPGNVLTTKNGLLFIDLETCCRGPVEFDLAHAPEEVSDHYPGVNHHFLRECRILAPTGATWTQSGSARFEQLSNQEGSIPEADPRDVQISSVLDPAPNQARTGQRSACGDGHAD